MTRGRRRLGVFLIVAAAVPLVVASAAYACARLSSIILDSRTERPGREVRFIGRNFNSNADVVLRWHSRTGAVLAQVRPNQRGTIAGSFRVPRRARSRSYVVLGTQDRADGKPAPGTPARAALRVRARRSRGAVAPPWVAAKPAEPGGPAGVLVELRSATPAPVTLGALLAAFALAGSGLVVLSGTARRQLRLAGPRRLH